MMVFIKLDIKRAKGEEKSLLYFEKHHSSSGYGYKILGMVLVIKRILWYYCFTMNFATWCIPLPSTLIMYTPDAMPDKFV